MGKEEFIKKIDNLIVQSKDIIATFTYKFCYDDIKKQAKTEEDVKSLEEGRKKSAKINFSEIYQSWYSEVLIIIKTILPERKNEFESLYVPPSNRKDLNLMNYTIFDAIRGLHRTDQNFKPSSAYDLLNTQVSILKSARNIVEDKLNEIQNLLEFDIFEKEIDSARYLLKNKYLRSAGAICGVILEKHLKNNLVVKNIPIKKDPTLNDLIESSYTNKIITITQYKYLMFLADIRNKCDHNKKEDPTKDEVEELIDGTDKVIKTYN